MDDIRHRFETRLAALRAEPSRDDPGDPARLRRIEATRTEMHGQPEALARTLASEEAALAALAARIRARGFDHVAIVGCGDSWFVGKGVRHALEEILARPVLAEQALDFAGYGHRGTGPGGLVIGLSAGGNTPAVMAALERARARGAFAIGVSNTPASPVLTAFDAGLVVHATRRGWPTQSSTAAMALLLALGLKIAPASAAADALAQALGAVPEAMARTLAAADAPMAKIASQIAASTMLVFAGSGPHGATASFGAAKVRELSNIHAAAFALEEIHHYRLPKPDDVVFVVAPDRHSRERALDTALVARAHGARVCVLTAHADADIDAIATWTLRVPDVAAGVASLAHAPAVHALACHFALARDAFQRADKRP